MDPQVPLPPLDKLIKPNQVTNLACLNTPEIKSKYFNGISEQWRKIQEHPVNHPEHIAAHRMLADVTTRLQRQMQKWRLEHSQNVAPSGMRPVSQSQQYQPGSAAQGFYPATQTLSNEVYSDNVKSAVRKLNLVLAPQMWTASTEEKEAWLQNEKRKYASQMQSFEKAVKAHQDLTNMVNIRRQQNRPFNDSEGNTIRMRQHQYQQAIQSSKEALEHFKKTQDIYREQHQQNSDNSTGQGIQTAGRSDSVTTSMPQAYTHLPTQISNSQMQPEQSLTANATSDTTRIAVSQGEHSTTPSTTTIPQGQAVSSQSNTSKPQSLLAGVPTSQGEHPLANSGVTHSQPHHSPQSASAQLPTSQTPYPLSHKAAMAQAARSYSQPNVNQPTSQSNPHAHPSMPREPQNATKWPISKNLNVAPLTPVVMGPARPTLSGGPSTGAMGPMGQPGIQKHPGFVLEGEGERVLSKKKLEELVRQVTGGNDGEGAEALDPDVEEVWIISCLMLQWVLGRILIITCADPS